MTIHSLKFRELAFKCAICYVRSFKISLLFNIWSTLNCLVLPSSRWRWLLARSVRAAQRAGSWKCQKIPKGSPATSRLDLLSTGPIHNGRFDIKGNERYKPKVRQSNIHGRKQPFTQLPSDWICELDLLATLLLSETSKKQHDEEKAFCCSSHLFKLII